MSKFTAGISHHLEEIAELKADRGLAVEYLKAAMEAFENPDERAGGLLALGAVAEAYGGLGSLAAEAGINPESVCRALLDKEPNLGEGGNFRARNT